MTKPSSDILRSSYWSDPRLVGDDEKKLKPSISEDINIIHDSVSFDGVSIPSFLQPFLGVEFVPYLPTYLPSDLTSLESSSNPMDDKIAENEITVPSLDCNIDADCLLLEEALSVEQTLTLSGDEECSPQEDSDIVSRRRRWRPKGNFIKKIIGRTDGRKCGRKNQQKKDQKLASVQDDASRLMGKAIDTTSTVSTSATTTTITTTTTSSTISTKDPFEWFREQAVQLDNQKSKLENLQSEAQIMRDRTEAIHQQLNQTQEVVATLRSAFIEAERRLRMEIQAFESAKVRLASIQGDALIASQTVQYLRRNMQEELPRLASSPRIEYGLLEENQPSDVLEVGLDGTVKATSLDLPLQIPTEVSVQSKCAFPPAKVQVESFMRVHDLQLSQSSSTVNQNTISPEFVFIGKNIRPIVASLSKLGYGVVTDESSRFVPTPDTERLLVKYKKKNKTDEISLDGWPIAGWKLAHSKDILVWTGDIGHAGFGSDWPVVKARGLVETSPRSLAEFMMDSSRVKEYNKMSQGREELVNVQNGLDTAAEDSAHGFPGDCKIVRALNRPRLLPTTIESISMTYTQPLTSAPGSYITVSRSVFEDDSGEHKSDSSCTIRSEMLLGVLLFRPANADHTITELTTITHIFSPGVPEMLARRAAPKSAYSIMKDIQNVFKT